MSPEHQNLPAWPLGCGIALLGLLLGVSLLGLGGILFATAALPPGIARAGPVLLCLAVPALTLVGWGAARRRNPYAARALLWACGIMLAVSAALTLLFNLIDRLNGL